MSEEKKRRFAVGRKGGVNFYLDFHQVFYDIERATTFAKVRVASDPIPQATAERKLFLEIAGVYNPKGSLRLSLPAHTIPKLLCSLGFCTRTSMVA